MNDTMDIYLVIVDEFYPMLPYVLINGEVLQKKIPVRIVDDIYSFQAEYIQLVDQVLDIWNNYFLTSFVYGYSQIQELSETKLVLYIGIKDFAKLPFLQQNKPVISTTFMLPPKFFAVQTIWNKAELQPQNSMPFSSFPFRRFFCQDINRPWMTDIMEEFVKTSKAKQRLCDAETLVNPASGLWSNALTQDGQPNTKYLYHGINGALPTGYRIDGMSFYSPNFKISASFSTELWSNDIDGLFDPRVYVYTPRPQKVLRLLEISTYPSDEAAGVFRLLASFNREKTTKATSYHFSEAVFRSSSFDGWIFTMPKEPQVLLFHPVQRVLELHTIRTGKDWKTIFPLPWMVGFDPFSIVKDVLNENYNAIEETLNKIGPNIPLKQRSAKIAVKWLFQKEPTIITTPVRWWQSLMVVLNAIASSEISRRSDAFLEDNYARLFSIPVNLDKMLSIATDNAINNLLILVEHLAGPEYMPELGSVSPFGATIAKNADAFLILERLEAVKHPERASPESIIFLASMAGKLSEFMRARTIEPVTVYSLMMQYWRLISVGELKKLLQFQELANVPGEEAESLFRKVFEEDGLKTYELLCNSPYMKIRYTSVVVETLVPVALRLQWINLLNAIAPAVDLQYTMAYGVSKKFLRYLKKFSPILASTGMAIVLLRKMVDIANDVDMIVYRIFSKLLSASKDFSGLIASLPFLCNSSTWKRIIENNNLHSNKTWPSVDATITDVGITACIQNTLNAANIITVQDFLLPLPEQSPRMVQIWVHILLGPLTNEFRLHFTTLLDIVRLLVTAQRQADAILVAKKFIGTMYAIPDTDFVDVAEFTTYADIFIEAGYENKYMLKNILEPAHLYTENMLWHSTRWNYINQDKLTISVLKKNELILLCMLVQIAEFPPSVVESVRNDIIQKIIITATLGIVSTLDEIESLLPDFDNVLDAMLQKTPLDELVKHRLLAYKSERAQKMPKSLAKRGRSSESSMDLGLAMSLNKIIFSNNSNWFDLLQAIYARRGESALFLQKKIDKIVRTQASVHEHETLPTPDVPNTWPWQWMAVYRYKDIFIEPFRTLMDWTVIQKAIAHIQEEKYNQITRGLRMFKRLDIFVYAKVLVDLQNVQIDAEPDLFAVESESTRFLYKADTPFYVKSLEANDLFQSVIRELRIAPGPLYRLHNYQAVMPSLLSVMQMYNSLMNKYLLSPDEPFIYEFTVPTLFFIDFAKSTLSQHQADLIVKIRHTLYPAEDITEPDVESAEQIESINIFSEQIKQTSEYIAVLKRTDAENNVFTLVFTLLKTNLNEAKQILGSLSMAEIAQVNASMTDEDVKELAEFIHHNYFKFRKSLDFERMLDKGPPYDRHIVLAMFNFIW